MSAMTEQRTIDPDALTLDTIRAGALRGRPVTVLGFARTGIALARFLADAGARVTVYDGRPTAELMQMVPEPYVELTRMDADRLGIAEGQTVEVSSRKGRLVRRARVNGRCPPGVCFAPSNLGTPRINTLLDWHSPQVTVRVAPVREPAMAGAR